MDLNISHVDSLIEIPDEQLEDLRAIYKDYKLAPYVYSFINTSIKWKKLKPDKNYLTYYAPNGNWKIDGTFIVHMQFSCYDFFVFTLDESCKRLMDALINTKRFDWNKQWLFFAVHGLHFEAIDKVLKEIKSVPDHITPTDIYAINVEDALNADIKCPEEVYVRKLNVDDAEIINNLWPHNYEGSIEYIKIFIEMNDGFGIYLKETNEICSWILKNQMGTMGILQTAEKFKRKGYGSLVTKVLAKEIAGEGHVPLGTVLTNNLRSQNMFKKLGYHVVDRATFIVKNGSK